MAIRFKRHHCDKYFKCLVLSIWINEMRNALKKSSHNNLTTNLCHTPPLPGSWGHYMVYYKCDVFDAGCTLSGAAAIFLSMKKVGWAMPMTIANNSTHWMEKNQNNSPRLNELTLNKKQFTPSVAVGSENMESESEICHGWSPRAYLWWCFEKWWTWLFYFPINIYFAYCSYLQAHSSNDIRTWSQFS